MKVCTTAILALCLANGAVTSPQQGPVPGGFAVPQGPPQFAPQFAPAGVPQPAGFPQQPQAFAPQQPQAFAPLQPQAFAPQQPQYYAPQQPAVAAPVGVARPVAAVPVAPVGAVPAVNPATAAALQANPQRLSELVKQLITQLLAARASIDRILAGLGVVNGQPPPVTPPSVQPLPLLNALGLAPLLDPLLGGLTSALGLSRPVAQPPRRA